MHVQLYLPEFPAQGAPLRSGTIRAVHGLASALAKQGVGVTVLCEGRRPGTHSAPEGFEIRCFPGVPGTLRHALSSALSRYIRECEDPGVIVLNGIFNPGVLALARACRSRGVAHVVAPHDPYNPAIFAKRRYLKLPYWYVAERPMLRAATAIQVLDLRHAQWLRSAGVETRAFEVPNGYLDEDVSPMETLEWRLEGGPRLLFLGRVDSYNKGLDLLLHAVRALETRPEPQLVIQGPDWGDLASMSRLASKLSLQGRVEFLPADFSRPASRIMADHDVFVLPSRFEGFGLSALEAMLAGRVLLVSEIAGIARHVDACGCGVVARPEVEEIASGLQDLLEKRPKWREMGLRGRRYALENLTWDSISRRAIECYGSLRAEGTHSGRSWLSR